jgi:hypothetical protein
MRLTVILAVSFLPLLSQEKPPAAVDEALRARYSQFYQAHVDGKFRQAEKFVAEDSKDFFYEMEKQRLVSIEGSEITYSDNFTKAKVLTTVNSEVRIPRIGTKVVKRPILSNWKLVNGDWYWYHVAEEYRETPFGRVKMPDEETLAAERRLAAIKRVTPSEVLSQVKVEGSAVALSSYQPASGAIKVTNNMPGNITVDVQYPPVEGLKVTIENKVLKSGETGKVIFECNPPNNTPKGNITANIMIQPLGQIFPITVTFAVPRPSQIKSPQQ